VKASCPKLTRAGRCLQPGEVRKPSVPWHYGTLGSLTHLVFALTGGDFHGNGNIRLGHRSGER
jgi:hypothetical protein